ncbi:MAG: hypothetical protein U9Q66_01585 [Patescibacteria group bacterium]|nr:hypothetical protein [Patescibacteria group bacterium]
MIVVINKGSATLYGDSYYEVRDMINSDVKSLGFTTSDEDLLLMKQVTYEDALLLDNDGMIASKQLHLDSTVKYFEETQRLARFDIEKKEYVMSYDY